MLKFSSLQAWSLVEAADALRADEKPNRSKLIPMISMHYVCMHAQILEMQCRDVSVHV